MARIFTVYYKPTCPYSIKALKLLEEQFPDATIQRTVINGSNELIFQNNARIALGLKPDDKGRLTYPQIWVDTKHIGGCDDLEQVLRSGELTRADLE